MSNEKPISYECGSADAYENKLREVRKENAELHKLLPDFGPADRRHVGDVLEENRALKTENQTLREKVQKLGKSNSRLFNIDHEFQRTQTMLKADNEKLQTRITALRSALEKLGYSLNNHRAVENALTADDKAGSGD